MSKPQQALENLAKRILCLPCRNGQAREMDKRGKLFHPNVDGSGLIAYCDEYIEYPEHVQEIAKLIEKELPYLLEGRDGK